LARHSSPTNIHSELKMKLLFDRDIYEGFTQAYLVKASRFVWIATANVKGTGILYRGKFMTFVDLMASLVSRGVSFRIIHAELPSAPFRRRYEQLDGSGLLSAGVEFLHCIRMHAKIFVVDGEAALVGSPNLTGAGIGAKSEKNRNFEIGFLLEGKPEVEPFMDYFDYLWMGGPCPSCGRRDLCPAPPA
jgi:phosphatidylserine/phosphatidylglycerophosphate/cardiolipin synthase-like enzyme